MYSFLALGDSYTVGEQVPLHHSFPYLCTQLLRDRGIAMAAPEIVAVTGYTTDELNTLIAETRLLPPYDLVTLLIGVNNQYRGRSAASFQPEFEQLLQQAITFSGNRKKHVVVLSIPDWGVTPFGASKDPVKIAEEIDQYNSVCAAVALEAGIHFINITENQRADGALEAFLASDQLHPSGKEYAKWARELADYAEPLFKV